MNDTYLMTYPHLVSFCSSKIPFSEESLMQAILMVYGWMPTTLKIKGDINESLKAINELIEREYPAEENLESARKLINNSIVGLSKLLHFSKPEIFPIWDSKIAEVQCGLTHHYQVNNSSSYMKYFELIHRAIDSDKISEALKYSQKIPYEVSDVRAVEYFIFNGNKLSVDGC